VRLLARGQWKRPSYDDFHSVCRFCTERGEDLGSFPLQPIKFGGCERLFDLQRLVAAAIIRGHFLVDGIKGPLPLDLLPRVVFMGGGSNHSSHLGVPIMRQVIRDFLMARSYKGDVGIHSNDVHRWSKRAVRLRYSGLCNESIWDDVWQR
jgi:hypothetical protein